MPSARNRARQRRTVEIETRSFCAMRTFFPPKIAAYWTMRAPRKVERGMTRRMRVIRRSARSVKGSRWIGSGRCVRRAFLRGTGPPRHRLRRLEGEYFRPGQNYRITCGTASPSGRSERSEWRRYHSLHDQLTHFGSARNRVSRPGAVREVRHGRPRPHRRDRAPMLQLRKLGAPLTYDR
jgi:hypothetical protein